MPISDLLTEIYGITDNFACKGIQVEQMAAIRVKLREAYKLVQADTNETKNDEPEVNVELVQ